MQQLLVSELPAFSNPDGAAKVRDISDVRQWDAPPHLPVAPQDDGFSIDFVRDTRMVQSVACCEGDE